LVPGTDSKPDFISRAAFVNILNELV